MAWTTTTEKDAHASVKVLADKRTGVHIPHILTFNATVPTSPGAGAVVGLGTVPAGFKPGGVFFSTNGLSASAGVGLTVVIGDAGDPDRLMASVDADAALDQFKLAPAGYDYEYTVDTALTMTMLSGKTAVAAQKVSGFIIGSVKM